MPSLRTSEPFVRLGACSLLVGTLLLLAIVPASGLIGSARAEAVEDQDLVAARTALASMPLADRVSQLVMTSVPGTTLSAPSRRTLRAVRPGGVIVFAGNYRTPRQLRSFLRSIDSVVPGVLVTVDQEGEPVKRIPGAPPTRSHPQLGAANRVDVTRAQGRATGTALRNLGIDIDLAPVADLDLAPKHVMQQRSFGQDPARVARHVGAFVEGLHDVDAAAVVKHFPGFGGASVNSDDALARITRTRAQLLDADLAPFRTAIAADVDAVMVSHGVYTALDRRHPASTSPAVYDLLRDELGFDGVAVTDALHAAGFGAAARVGVAQGCVEAVRAGADIALLTGNLADAMSCRARLLRAVRSGTLARARVDEAATRVLRLRSRLGLLPAADQPAAGEGGLTG